MTIPVPIVPPSFYLNQSAMLRSRLARLASHTTCLMQSRSKFASSAPRTLYDKIWDDHRVDETDDGTALLYIDRHLVHEVTSPQAFDGLRLAGRPVRRPDCTLVTVDHNIPTTTRTTFKSVANFIKEPQSRTQAWEAVSNFYRGNIKRT